MYAHELYEAGKPQVVVTYPGRFQPFHQGHAGVFAQLQKKFGRDSVYILTSNDQSSAKSPFNFSDKYQLMTAAGVPGDRIIETNQMYKLPEGFDPASTVFITAVGAPDKDRLNPDTFTKRDQKDKDGNVTKPAGSASYYKTWDPKNAPMTADQHGYVVVIPEIHKEIAIKGKKYDVSHGTECRNLWNAVRNDAEARKEFLAGLYGRASAELAHIFDKIPATVSEDIGQTDSNYSSSPISGARVFHEIEDPKEKRYHDWQEFDQDKTAQVVEFLREMQPAIVEKFGAEYIANLAHQAFQSNPQRSLTQLAGDVIRTLKQGVSEGLEDYEGIKIKFSKDSDGVAVKALSDDGNRVLASVELFFNEKGQLEPQDLWTNDRYQGQGIAKAMYDFLKNKGYTIIRSWDQTDAGKGFWDKHKGPEVNVWEQGVSEDAAGVGVVAKNKKMAKDPRYSMSMTKDVKPSTPRNMLRAFRLAEDFAAKINPADFEIKNFDKLDFILKNLCEMVVAGQRSEPDVFGMVAACVLDPDNRFAFGINYLKDDTGRRIHAERCAIQTYEAEYGRIPAGSIILTTLSPCCHPMDERYGDSCTEIINDTDCHKVYCGYKDPTQDEDMNKTFHVMQTRNPAIVKMCKKFAATFLGNVVTEDKESHSVTEEDMMTMIKEFMPLAMKELKLKEVPHIILEPHIESHDGQATFGRFVNEEEKIYLGIADRHPVDILRTLAHELVHFKQYEQGKMYPGAGETGSPIENEAHWVAGIIMRHFNKKYPDAIKSKPLELDEAVNPDVTSDDYFLEPTKNVRMGDFEFNARTFTGGLGNPNARGLQIRAYDPKNLKSSIGSADFIVKTDKKGNSWLESDDTEVDELYRGKGVAAMMYAFAKSLGNDIKDSPYKSKAGSDMWTKWGSDAKHLTSENFADGRNPQDKGDSARHGIPKKASLASLDKIVHSKTASPRKKQLAHWQANMRRGRQK